MAEVELVRGSDKDLVLAVKDSNNDPIDLSGRVLNLFDISRSLTGKVSGSISDPTNGLVSIHIEGTAPLPLGLHSFRMQLTDGGGSSLAIKPISLRVV